MERHTYRVTITVRIDSDGGDRESDRSRLHDRFTDALDTARWDNPDLEVWYAKDEPGPVMVRDCEEDKS